MFRRLYQVLRSWFGAGLTNLTADETENLLAEAQAEMRLMHKLNRDRAIASISGRNRLQKKQAFLSHQMAVLHSALSEAQARGDIAAANKILDDLRELGEQHDTVTICLEIAVEEVESTKRAIRLEDQKVRDATRRALELKSQWLRSQANFRDNPSPLPVGDGTLAVIALVILDVCLLGLLWLCFRG